MTNDEGVDYFGRPTSTHYDWECTEKMDDALRDLSPNHLNTRDEELLEEYAPKLFDELPKKYNLFTETKNLVSKINSYRVFLQMQGKIDESYKWQKEKYANKGYESKMKTISDRAGDILAIIGKYNAVPIAQLFFHQDLHFDIRNKLSKLLENMKRNPDRFMPPPNLILLPKKSNQTSKDGLNNKISIYLKTILPSRKKELIEVFMDDLENLPN